MVKVRVPWEPELLDPWKAAWDRLIWKAMIPKVKAIEGELNRNPRSFKAGRSQLLLIGIKCVGHPDESFWANVGFC
jgi:hypothetical protein